MNEKYKQRLITTAEQVFSILTENNPPEFINPEDADRYAQIMVKTTLLVALVLGLENVRTSHKKKE